MEAVTTALVAQLFASGAATVVATADAGGRAAITRGWGVAMASDGRVTLCVTASTATRANLAANGRLAVTVVDPTTYASVQLKGVADVVRDPTDVEREGVAAHVRRFGDAVATIGLDNAECMMLGDLATVAFLPVEVTNQTPGNEAGQSMA